MNEKQTRTEALVRGKWGELEAIRMIREQGMEVLDVNWTFLHLEIDIVARDGNTLVIGEVKTRSTNAYGEPEMFVTPAKQKRLIRAANMYLQQKHLDNEVRFDVIGIVKNGNLIERSYVKDAFSTMA